MGNGAFQSKTLTRDYHSLCQTHLHVLDVMVTRRSWRRYQEWAITSDLQSQLEEFITRAKHVRRCPDDGLILVTDKSRLPELFQAAYKGFAGKINPWLPKSSAAGFLALVIPEQARHRDRPLAYTLPAMVAQDTALWLTENGLGSVWLGGLNAKQMAKSLRLPPDKVVAAILMFGKTGLRPQGLNIDNILYKTLSRKRKNLHQIVYQDFYGKTFHIPGSLSQTLSVKSLTIAESMDALTRWDEDTSPGDISQLEWELLTESARIAPSGANRQQWKFILIKDKALHAELRRLLNETRAFSGIIACLGMPGSFEEMALERPFWMIDLPIAMSHISIMAGALDLSSKVYLDIPEADINAVLKLDPTWRTVGLVGLKQGG